MYSGQSISHAAFSAAAIVKEPLSNNLRIPRFDAAGL
jgi:hypothetical protein